MAKISIIDYGVGNICSVKRAFESLGATVNYVSTPEDLLNADRLVIPGVGAFKNGMEELRNRGLVFSIKKYCDTNKPFLGICLGMQMMLDSSEEFGVHEGLGIIPGIVKKIVNCTIEGNYQKVPHVGWYASKYFGDTSDSVFGNIPESSRFYYVHSYAACLENEKFCIAKTIYGGREITAVIRKGNVYGVQFHPEKSGEIGRLVLKNFLDL